ncbi:MAG: META domain-containing protein [Bacteroidales bacterium]
MDKYLCYAVILSAFLVIGCSSTKSVALNGKWSLETINEKAVSKSDQIPYIEINISDKRIGGYDGCNNIGGDLIIGKHDEITFDKMISTMRFCHDQGENAMLGKVLESVRRYEIITAKDNNKTLLLFDENNIKTIILKWQESNKSTKIQ